jgi:TonB family protein
LALILHALLAWVDLDLFKTPISARDLPKTLTIDIFGPQPAKEPLTVKGPSIVVKKPTLKKKIKRTIKPKPRVTTPTLPSPFPEGGIYDKGEGLGGGEKWDFLYNRVKPRSEDKKSVQPRLAQQARPPAETVRHPAPREGMPGWQGEAASGISGQTEKSIAKEKLPKKDETLAQLSPVDLAAIKKEEVTHALPVYRRNTPPQYPLIARRRGYQGRVLLEVLVRKNGRAGSIRLARSSGYEVLDRAAIKGVRNWLFHPAKRGDELVEMWVEIPIRFQLN